MFLKINTSRVILIDVGNFCCCKKEVHVTGDVSERAPISQFQFRHREGGREIERGSRQTGERDNDRELWPVQWRQCGPLLASCGIGRGRGVASGCVILRDQLEAHGRSRRSRDISTSTRGVANSRKTMKFPFSLGFPWIRKRKHSAAEYESA